MPACEPCGLGASPDLPGRCPRCRSVGPEPGYGAWWAGPGTIAVCRVRVTRRTAPGRIRPGAGSRRGVVRRGAVDHNGRPCRPRRPSPHVPPGLPCEPSRRRSWPAWRRVPAASRAREPRGRRSRRLRFRLRLRRRFRRRGRPSPARRPAHTRRASSRASSCPRAASPLASRASTSTATAATSSWPPRGSPAASCSGAELRRVRPCRRGSYPWATGRSRLS